MGSCTEFFDVHCSVIERYHQSSTPSQRTIHVFDRCDSADSGDEGEVCTARLLLPFEQLSRCKHTAPTDFGFACRARHSEDPIASTLADIQYQPRLSRNGAHHRRRRCRTRCSARRSRAHGARPEPVSGSWPRGAKPPAHCVAETPDVSKTRGGRNLLSCEPASCKVFERQFQAFALDLLTGRRALRSERSIHRRGR